MELLTKMTSGLGQSPRRPSEKWGALNPSLSLPQRNVGCVDSVSVLQKNPSGNIYVKFTIVINFVWVNKTHKGSSQFVTSALMASIPERQVPVSCVTLDK